MKKSSFKRTLLLVLTGGVLVQIGGCATITAPLLLSLAENVLLSFIFGGALGL